MSAGVAAVGRTAIGHRIGSRHIEPLKAGLSICANVVPAQSPDMNESTNAAGEDPEHQCEPRKKRCLPENCTILLTRTSSVPGSVPETCARN